MVKLTDRPAMTIAVDLGRKATKTKCSGQLLVMYERMTKYCSRILNMFYGGFCGPWYTYSFKSLILFFFFLLLNIGSTNTI